MGLIEKLSQINSELNVLTENINNTTGEYDQKLSDAVNRVLEGYGEGDSTGSLTYKRILDHTVVLNLASDTDFLSKTPTTSAQQIYAAKTSINDENGNPVQCVLTMNEHDYILLALSAIDFSYNGTPSVMHTPKKRITFNLYYPNRYVRDSTALTPVQYVKRINQNGDYTGYGSGVMSNGNTFSSPNLTPVNTTVRASFDKIDLQANNTYTPASDIQLIDAQNTTITNRWIVFECDKSSNAVTGIIQDLIRNS